VSDEIDAELDRTARRPHGEAARATYAEPTYHLPNFELILERLALTPEDRFLEVGCGGGVLLARALETVASGAAVDHAPEMVALARERSPGATVAEASADALPFGDAAFTAAAMTGVLHFLPDPVPGFREVRRCLAPGGRFAVFSSTEAMRGTPAAPEPLASRMHWHAPDDVARMARAAGFAAAEVEDPDLEPYARRAGLPDDVVPFFRGTGGSLLLLATA
jgi:SAM-dependent methyltransferase